MNSPKPLPHRHRGAPWRLHSVRRAGILQQVQLETAFGEIIAVEFAGDGLYETLEHLLIDYERAARCVNACELLSTDHPDREIEALLKDRARLMDILAGRGYKRPSEPAFVLRPGSDEDAATESEKIQIGPTDI